MSIGTLDLNRLAHAVSIAETSGCTKGRALSQNNCFGIRNGSIAPCKKIVNDMCAYETQEQSFQAFKKIWAEGYGSKFPTLEMARVWTANDSPDSWLDAVKKNY